MSAGYVVPVDSRSTVSHSVGVGWFRFVDAAWVTGDCCLVGSQGQVASFQDSEPVQGCIAATEFEPIRDEIVDDSLVAAHGRNPWRGLAFDGALVWPRKGSLQAGDVATTLAVVGIITRCPNNVSLRRSGLGNEVVKDVGLLEQVEEDVFAAGHSGCIGSCAHHTHLSCVHQRRESSSDNVVYVLLATSGPEGFVDHHTDFVGIVGTEHILLGCIVSIKG